MHSPIVCEPAHGVQHELDQFSFPMKHIVTRFYHHRPCLTLAPLHSLPQRRDALGVAQRAQGGHHHEAHGHRGSAVLRMRKRPKARHVILLQRRTGS
eukprot:scaffold128540_cov69-Phaeocystis_antarctica.AAC.2